MPIRLWHPPPSLPPTTTLVAHPPVAPPPPHPHPCSSQVANSSSAARRATMAGAAVAVGLAVATSNHSRAVAPPLLTHGCASTLGPAAGQPGLGPQPGRRPGWCWSRRRIGLAWPGHPGSCAPGPYHLRPPHAAGWDDVRASVGLPVFPVMGSGWTCGRLAADGAEGQLVGNGHLHVDAYALVQGYIPLSLTRCSFFYYSRPWCTYPCHISRFLYPYHQYIQLHFEQRPCRPINCS